MLARLFYGEPATPAPLSADPAMATLQQQFQAALSEMRHARAAIIEEQRRTNQSVADTQQRLTSLTEIVSELRTLLPVSPKQAEYIQRAIKRIATRLAMMPYRSTSAMLQSPGSSARPRNCCPATLTRSHPDKKHGYERQFNQQ